MILKGITLQNFRSYGDAPTRIELDKGVLLFEGDIGSGKSSILYAIEFALFGLGEVESRYILRSSASAGRVELEFEVGGEEYKVVRVIERKKGTKVIQTRGWISERGGVEEELSPTELKTRILQILNFKEKPGKSSSRIYRFAVFTPQELMREVLAQKPDERIETLRRAFGIEDYSFAGTNAELVVSRLDRQALVHTELSRNLPTKEADLSSRKNSLDRNLNDLKTEEKKLSEISERIRESQEVVRTLESERDKVNRLQTLIPQLEQVLAVSQDQLLEAKILLEKHRQNLREVEKARLQIIRLKSDHEKYTRGKARLRDLETLQDQRLTIEKSISELSKKVSTREASLKAELSSKEEDLKRYERTISSYDEDLDKLSKLEETAKELESKIRELPRVQEQLDRLNSEVGAERAIQRSKAAEIFAHNEQLGKLDGLANNTKCPLCGQDLNKEHLGVVAREYREKLTTLNSQIKESELRLQDLNKRIRELESEKQEAQNAQKESESIGRKIARIQQIKTTRDKTRAELEELRSKVDLIKSDLENREFAHSEEVELASLKMKKEALVEPLEELSELKEMTKRLEDSGVERDYLTAENTLAKSKETAELVTKQEEKVSALEHTISKKNQEIKERRAELEELEPLIFQYSKLKEELQELETQRIRSKERFDRLSTAVQFEQEQIEQLSREVDELKKSSSKAALYRGYSSWMETLFLPAITDIETYVLDSINDEFKHVFQKWFATLMEEGEISVSVDDRFTPIVEQSGYELDVQSLSGGERTAVALAYRLALNYMVKRANEAMQTNLLILDEPTEGFSKEQVYRLRNVLEELDCDQVVLVSHERDLETMADRVYRVEKANGESTVTLLQ